MEVEVDEQLELGYEEEEVDTVVAVGDVAVDVVDIDRTGSWGGTVEDAGTVVEDEEFEKSVYGFDGNVLLQIVESVLVHMRPFQHVGPISSSPCMSCKGGTSWTCR